MREIKFRAWDSIEHKMCRVKSFKFSWDIEGEFANRINWVETDINSTPCDLKLMQYTGLKDKNGKEIYEGDIVTLIDNSSKWGEEDCLTIKVKWSETGLNWNVYPCLDPKKYWKVIGNIFSPKK